MSRVQKLRVFVSQRLNAALEEILAVFEKTIVKYEQEAALCQEVISRQHALLCALHKPLMEVPSADAFAQQLMLTKPPHAEDQDQNQEDPQPSHVAEDQERARLPDLDETDIIQFTYKPGCAARPGEDVDRSQSEPGSADPDQDVQLVLSSETEDSDDYGKDSAEPGSAPDQLKPKTVCSRTFRARRSLFRHIKAHLQEPEQVCGLCGERFQTTDSLRLHIQAHWSPGRRREPQIQTRTQSRERRLRQRSDLGTNPRVHQKPNRCDDCGKTFPQVWKKKKHRCQPRSLEGTKRKT